MSFSSSMLVRRCPPNFPSLEACFHALEIVDRALRIAIGLDASRGEADLHRQVAREVDILERLQNAAPIDGAFARRLAVDVGEMNMIELRRHFIDVVRAHFIAIKW